MKRMLGRRHVHESRGLRPWRRWAWALPLCAAFQLGHASGGETWAFTDGEGVLHMGNVSAGKANAPSAPPAATAAAKVDSANNTPDFVARRGLTWINHTWRMRYPAWDPSAPVEVAPTQLAAGVPPFKAMAGLKLPRGFEAMRPYLESAAHAHAVEPALVFAVAAAESAFNPNAVSHKGALGLMQIMPATAERYGVARPASPHVRHAVLEPQVNASVGSRYLADLLRRYGGDKTLALAAYNAGEGAVARYGNRVPPFPETRQYVDKVLRYYQTMTQ